MNNELTVDEKIKTFLLHYGITEDVNIPEEEKELVLLILGQSDVDKVYVENGDLIIESYMKETDEQRTI